MRCLFAAALACVVHYSISAQVVFEPSRNAVYPFLEEMAALGHIRINTFAKPFSRKQIAQALDSLRQHSQHLNARQLYQLEFFAKDYGKEWERGTNWKRRKDLLYRSDSTFQLTINPILGGSLMQNQNGTRVHTRIGAEFFATAGRVGMYGSLRDNTVTDALALPQHITTLDGQNYKTIESAARNDYNEAMGGISYQWRWGDISLVKERYIWGNTQRHANIFSGKAPSYAAIYLRIYPWEWLDFQYMHGWTVSEVLDSARTYLAPAGNRRVMTNKNIAANFITIKSKWNIDFTAGNSIVYSDAGVQPVYFIPFMFFKSADHTYSGTGSNELGQNAQMYFDISTRAIRKVHLYTSLFMDELNIGNMWSPSAHTNIWSIKAGGVYYNLLPDVHITAEYTHTAPWTYRHQVPSTTFASNGYNLGHFAGENADELYTAISWMPWRNLSTRLSAWMVRKGPEHVYEIIQGNANVTGLPFMESISWEQKAVKLDVTWEPYNGAVLFVSAWWQRNKGLSEYVPDFLLSTDGGRNIMTVEAGFRIGW